MVRIKSDIFRGDGNGVVILGECWGVCEVGGTGLVGSVRVFGLVGAGRG
jgi:hypothetical protein